METFHQISLTLLNTVYFYNLVKMFAEVCFKMKLLMEKCTVLCKILKYAHVCKHSLANLDLGHCVELSSLRPSCVESYVNDLKMKVFILTAF